MSYGQSDTVFLKYDSDKYDERLTYKTDTVVFETFNDRQILYGTTILPWTDNQQNAKGYGLDLAKVSSTPCKQDIKPEGKNEVVSISETDTTLNLELKIFGNCCHSFLCDIAVVEDSLINLLYFGYGATHCDCDCCYGLTYNLTTTTGKYSDYGKLKMVMINGDRKTLKRLN